MKLAVRRRGVTLEPASDADVLWIFEQFDREDAWRAFGYAGPAMAEAMWSYLTREMILAVIRRVDSSDRCGFVVLFPPSEGHHAWEFGYVITDLRARDAFTAMAAVDATGHYMFDLLGVEAVSFRVKEENRAALAVILRLGYRPERRVESDEGVNLFFTVGRADWNKRRKRLAAPEFQVLERPETKRWRPRAA